MINVFVMNIFVFYESKAFWQPETRARRDGLVLTQADVNTISASRALARARYFNVTTEFDETNPVCPGLRRQSAFCPCCACPW
jgi:hypothetical protein